MTAQLIDGNAIAKSIRADLATVIEGWRSAGHRQPGLAVILVGNDPASEVYVKGKRRDCEQVGVHSLPYICPQIPLNPPSKTILINSMRIH